jgi:23S rRNA (guanosine2251-2'-O)-methyltransferase
MVAGAVQVNEKSPGLPPAPAKLPIPRARGMTLVMRDHDRKTPGAPKPGQKPGTTREQAGRRERAERARRASLRPESDDVVALYGWHTVKAALENPARKVRKLLATDNAARRLSEEGVKLEQAPEIVRPGQIAERLLPDAVHQGLYLEADALPLLAIETIPSTGIVLVLDQITDPHNVGAIFRSAAAFAATAIVTTQRHSPESSGALAKAASGAIEHVPLFAVQNLSRALQALKQNGFLTVGLDSEAHDTLEDVPLSAPLALVLGAEGKGLRQLTKETCDHLARLDLPGSIKSLNVSNAAALSLHVAHSRLKALASGR